MYVLKTAFLTLAVVTLATLALSGCGRRAGSPEAGAADAAASRSSLTVTTVRPLQKSLVRDIVASGSVAAWEETSLGVELSGVRVSRVLVEVGSRVKAGQALVELDRRTLNVQARQAEGALAQARASLDVARAAAQRGESLLANKLISVSNSEELGATLRRAEAQVTVAEADRDAARLRVGFATLRAPDAGIVSSRSVQPGQVVASGNELLRLIRQGRLEWRAEVSDADLPRVTQGASVELSAPGGAVVEGRIRAVSPAVDAQRRTALIYADLPRDAPGLRAGMFVQGRLRTGSFSATVLPREALVFRDGLAYVFLLGADGRVKQRRVDVGATQGDEVELKSRLEPDARIVARGAGFLSDGDLVRTAETPAAGARVARP